MLTKAPAAPRRVFAPWADAAAQPVVAFRNVSKRFGGFTAISDVSLDIYAGEFFALLGPSGCGKTTLMRMVAGFEEPTTGEVLLDGEGLAGIPPYRRPVNMMFQSYALFPHMSVADNIAFGLKQERLGKAEIGRRVEEMLALVQLEGLAGRKPDQLSGGQRQRVALARSLAKKPRVLLLDEPLAALDKKLREETQFELVDLQQRLHLTFVIVTHDQEEAMTVADRIAVMDQGRILQVAPPAEIYEQPNCRAVASFIGDINLIEARVSAAAADGLRLTAFGGALIPIQRGGQALRHAMAVLVEIAQAVHRPRIAALGRHFPPFHRFLVALLDAVAVGVEQAEVVHAQGVAAPGRLLPEAHRLAEVGAFGTHATRPQQAEVVDRAHVAHVGAGDQVVRIGGNVARLDFGEDVVLVGTRLLRHRRQHHYRQQTGEQQRQQSLLRCHDVLHAIAETRRGLGTGGPAPNGEADHRCCCAVSATGTATQQKDRSGKDRSAKD